MTEDVRHAENIRELLGHLVGQHLIDIVQKDSDEAGDQFTEFLFEDGNSVKFFLAPGESYQCGFPMCFSDPNPDKPESDGFYHPSEENTAARKWAVVEDITPTGKSAHVIPCFGQLHAVDETCWCRPDFEMCENGIAMFNHKEVEDDTTSPCVDPAGS